MFDVNAPNLDRTRFYKREELAGLDGWTAKKTGFIAGRSYKVYSQNFKIQCLPRFLKGAEAAIKTIFSLGILLSKSSFRATWKEIYSGEQERTIRVLNDVESISTTLTHNRAIRYFSGLEEDEPGISYQRHLSLFADVPIAGFSLPLLSSLASDEASSKRVSLFPDLSGSFGPGLALFEWSTLSNDESCRRTRLHMKQICALDERLEARLNVFDASFQVRARMTLFKDRSYMQTLKLEDLEAPWSESALSIALLTNDELTNLKGKQLLRLTYRQIEILHLRLSEVPTIEKVTKEIVFETLTLAEIGSLTSEQLRPLVQSCPSNFVPLLKPTQILQGLNEGLFDQSSAHWISSEQIVGIDFCQLNLPKRAEILSAIFRQDFSYYIAVVSNPNELYHLIPYLDSFSLSNISPTAIKNLDFKHVAFNKRTFDKMFSPITKSKIRNLSSVQLLDCLSRGFFDKTSIGYIPDRTLITLDLSGLTNTSAVEALRTRRAKL